MHINQEKERCLGGGKKKDTHVTDVEGFGLPDVITQKTFNHQVYPGGVKSMEQSIVNALRNQIVTRYNVRVGIYCKRIDCRGRRQSIGHYRLILCERTH